MRAENIIGRKAKTTFDNYCLHVRWLRIVQDIWLPGILVHFIQGMLGRRIFGGVASQSFTQLLSSLHNSLQVARRFVAQLGCDCKAAIVSSRTAC